MKKRLLSLFLAVLMIVGMIPAQAFAVDAEGNTLYVGDQEGQYATLEAAHAAAEDGDTITLCKDVDLESQTLYITKILTLDLNGHKIESTEAAIQISANGVTITDSGEGGEISGYYGVYVVEGTATILGGTVSGTDIGVMVYIGTLNIKGGTISSGSYGVYADQNSVVNISGGNISGAGGICLDGGSTLNISGGTVTGQDGSGADVNFSTANITGGNISGADGVVVFEGTANISGGTVTASGSGSYGVYLGNNGTANISENANIGGGYWGVYVYGSEAKANITGGNISNTQYGVYVNIGEAEISENANISRSIFGIYVYGGDATIYGGTISGDSDSVYVGAGTLSITGGTFNTDPSEYVDKSAYSVTEQDGWYVVSAGGSTEPTPPASDYVAMVGEQGFETLQAAYEAVNDTNNTITLLKDIDLGYNYLEIGKKVTIDLGGKTISGSVYAFHIKEGGELTVTGEGTVSGSSYGIFAVGGKLNIHGGTISGESSGVYLQGSEPTVNIYGGTVSGKNSGVFVEKGTANIYGGSVEAAGGFGYGINAITGTVVNIEGGNISGSQMGVAYHADGSSAEGNKLSISGGTISGNYGINVKCCELSISGGTISGNYGIIAENESTTNITGGTITDGSYSVYLMSGATATISGGEHSELYASNGTTLTVTGGKFKTDPSEYVDKSAYSVTEQDGWYVVSTGGSTEPTPPAADYVAMVGTQGFESLEAALASPLSTNSTITLCKDIKLSTTLNISKKVTIDLGEYDIKSFGNVFEVAANGELLIKGSGTISGNNVVTVTGGKVTVESGNISANTYGMMVWSGNVTILGGTIHGRHTGIYYSSGNHGIYGGTVSGGTYGVNVAGGKCEITGGRFSHDPSQYVDSDKYQVTTENNWYFVEEKAQPVYVAMIGEQGYETLQAAYEAVNDTNNTITLLKNVDLGDNYLEIGKKVTIDLGGYDVSSAVYAFHIEEGGELTVTGEGTVSGSSYGAFVDGGTVNIESGNISGGTYGVRVYDGTVNIKDGSVEATGSYSNGVYGQGNSFVNIEGGEVSGSTYGVNVVGGKATISGGTVSGFYGAFVDNGKCEIAGGTVSGSERGVYVTGVNNSELKISGGEVSGGLYGVYVYGSNAKADISGGSVLGGIYGVVAQEDCTVNIESGTVSGDDVVAVYGGKVNISGGTVTATSSYGAGIIAFDGKLTISGGEVSGADGVYIEYNGDGNTEVTITGGTVSGTDSGVDAYGGTINVSENANISGGNSGVYVAGGKLDIAGGSVKATGSHSYGVYGYGDAVINIEGGEVSGVNSGVGFYGGESISGKVNVSGGTVSGGSSGVNITDSEAIISGGYVSGSYCVYVDGGTAKITGGTIESTSVDGVVIIIMSGGEAEATGGRFNKHPMYFVPNTHQVTFEDGWFVVSKATKYNITVGTTVNGTVEVDKTSAKAGEIVTVTVTPMPGYELTNLSYKKNGMNIGIMGNSFAMPTGDVEIVATFKALPTYRIVMPSTFKGGTVTVDDKEAYAGQEVTVTAAANEGYELVFVSVMTAKGTQITLTDGKFTMPAEVVMIAAAFKEKASYVAQVGEQKFESLQAAIDAAENGDEIVLLSDITLTADDTMVIDGSIIGVFVTDKNIALDMNGKTISVDLTGMTGTIIPFATVRDGHLTINDTVGSGKITATGAKAYALFSAYNPASKLTINGGAFELAEAADCLIHANANEAVVVNGGTFTLDNVGTGNNYQPWIFNVNGKNASHVIVNGGTYNSDVNHQFWGNEVMVPETLAVKDNGDGTWTVTEAEAYIVEIGTSQHSAERKIGYATLADAIASVEKNAPETTIVLLKDVKVSGQYIGHSYAQKIVLDLNGKTLSSADRTLNIHRGGTEVLIKNGTVTGNTSAGTIQVSGGAKLTLENATIKSGSKAKAIKINKDGTLVINDASVKVQGGLDDLIVETGAQTLISAGTFNHDVSDYCVEEYGAVKNTDGTYTVKRVILVENVTTGVKYKTVADAIKDIAKNAGVQELKLLGDVTVKGQFIGHSYAQQVVIDLNGFKMSSTDKALTVYRAGTEVTIKNGTVHGNSTGGTIQVTYGGKLTLGENVTITSGGSANALKVDSSATLIIDNDTVKVQGGKNDLIVADGAKVEISAGYFKHPVAEAWCAEGKMPNPVKTADGWYTVMDAGAAVINGKAYETLHDAFAAVKNGETIKVMKNIDLANEETVTLAEQYKTYFKVEGKSVTIDLNGKTISGTAGNADNMLVGVFSTENDGHLTITGEGTVDVQDGGKVYALIVNYEDGCSIVIENGTYKLDAASDSLIYCGAGYAEGTEGILVQDGTFHLGNLGKGPNGNGSPWIFNVYHKNQNHIMVNGGTFNADVNHQFWANEVFVPETLALKDNDNGTWTVVEAAGYVVEIGVSQHSRERKVGYVDLAAFEGEDVLGNKDGEYFVTGAGSLKQFAEEVGGEVKLENSNIAMTEDITVAENKELLMKSDSRIAFNGGGNTITANGTGTKAGESYDYGYVGFIPANKEAATVENVTVTGSGFVEVGHHGTSMGGDYTINNLTVKDLIATLAINNGGNNIAAAFSHYGNAEMTDCVMTGTTTLKEGFKAYDAAFVNTTKTVMSGCTFGKIYLANQAHVTITNTVIDVIDSYAISTRNLGKLVIGAGAEIGVINLYDTGSYKATLVIEEGANVGAIVYNGVTYTAAEWMAR